MDFAGIFITSLIKLKLNQCSFNLVSILGCDGSYMFEQVGHSEEARKLMIKYCKGYVKHKELN